MKRLGILLSLLCACDDAPPADADAGVAEACRQSDLIAQCPPGSNPLLGETAAGLCAGGAELRNLEGAVTGQCYGEGQCVVACQFAAACRCGVDRITRDGVFCVACPDENPCGDGVCAAGENPQTCPQDCAGECVPMSLRCQGEAIESCNLRGQWEALACPRGEVCSEAEGAPQCVREDIIGGGDAGVGDAGGPRISGRLLFGDAEYPGTGALPQPGSGRDLARLGRFGILRSCTGNDAQIARCREAIVQQPRDELVNFERLSAVYASVGEDVLLWGTHQVVALGFDGGGPQRGERAGLDVFCPHYAQHCLGQPDACVDGVPDAVRTAYESWAYGSEAMGCWLAGELCVPSVECQLAGRVLGYDAGRRIARPEHGTLSRDGRSFAFWLDERQVGLYDMETRTVSVVGNVGSYLGAGGNSLAFSADGAFVAAVAVSGEQYDADTLVAVWPRAGGEPVGALVLDDVWPSQVALSPDGRVVAVARRNPPGNPRLNPEGIDVIDVASSTLIFRILPAEEPNPPNQNCFSHLNGGLEFSPAGDRLAAGAQMIGGLGCNPAAVVEVWNLATGVKEQTLPGFTRGAVDQLRYSPDGTTLAVSARLAQAPSDLKYELNLWDATSGALLTSLERQLSGEQLSADGLAYSVDGRRLVAWGSGSGGDDFALSYIAVYGVAP